MGSSGLYVVGVSVCVCASKCWARMCERILFVCMDGFAFVCDCERGASGLDGVCAYANDRRVENANTRDVVYLCGLCVYVRR